MYSMYSVYIYIYMYTCSALNPRTPLKDQRSLRHNADYYLTAEIIIPNMLRAPCCLLFQP